MPNRAHIALLLTALLLATTVLADSRDYVEVRNLALDADGLESMRADVGAGSLTIEGRPDVSRIRVEAVVYMEEAPRDEGKARELADRHLEMSLESRGDRAVLITRTRDPAGRYTLVHADLTVVVPERFSLDIRDRSGYIDLDNLDGPVVIRDQSGSITARNIRDEMDVEDSSGSIDLVRIDGAVRIDDDSGSISVDGAAGDVDIRDGSGSIDVRGVAGSVTIRDGSGSIHVREVRDDLLVLEDGSGSVRFDDIGGDVSLR